MPVLISTAEMNELAQKLAKFKYNKAMWKIRQMDKEARLDMYRDSVGFDEVHTRFALPNKNLWITLIERKEEYSLPNMWGHRKVRWKYVEARVEPIPEPVLKDKQLAE
ncbi:MAG: hypothetical protein KF716_24740 [Anaerolineae bacterium]|nr:hypothetical protein [Anaerolineae bacterium]